VLFDVELMMLGCVDGATTQRAGYSGVERSFDARLAILPQNEGGIEIDWKRSN
jgi:hypothetical protein